MTKSSQTFLFGVSLLFLIFSSVGVGWSAVSAFSCEDGLEHINWVTFSEDSLSFHFTFDSFLYRTWREFDMILIYI